MIKKTIESSKRLLNGILKYHKERMEENVVGIKFNESERKKKNMHYVYEKYKNILKK